MLANLKEAGITDVGIVVGHLKEKIEEYIGGLESELSITLIDQFEQIGTKKYGTACPIEAAQSFIQNQPFLSVFGDNVYATQDLRTIREQFSESCLVGGLENPHPELYSILIEQDGFLEHIIEKPTPEVCAGHLVNPGMYAFSPEIFDAVQQIHPSVRGEYEITDAVTLLAHQKKVKVIKMTGPWLDLGRPEDIAIVSKSLSN